MVQGSRSAAVAVVATVWMVTGSGPAFGADTVEPVDAGATDVELYLGAEGMRPHSMDGGVFADLVVGYGLTHRFSALVGTRLDGRIGFGDRTATFYAGAIGTPVDTRHFDLDLILVFEGGGPRFGRFGLTPMVEVNFDLDPEMKSWGAYLRAGFRLYAMAAPSEGMGAECERTHHLFALTVGTYYTVAPGHQLLAEWDFNRRTRFCFEEIKNEVGGVRAGYNFAVHKRVEFVAELFFDIPQHGERLSVGLMLGFIANLPGRRK